MATHSESLRGYEAITAFNRLVGWCRPSYTEMQRERQREKLEHLEALVHAVVGKKPQALEIFMVPYGRVETPSLSIRDTRDAVRTALEANGIQVRKRRAG